MATPAKSPAVASSVTREETTIPGWDRRKKPMGSVRMWWKRSLRIRARTRCPMRVWMALMMNLRPEAVITAAR